MSLQRVAPILVLLLVISVTAMVLTAGRDDRFMTSLAAASYVAVIIGVALFINIPSWMSPAAFAADYVGMMRRNIRLAALIYAWGGAVMLAVYSLSGLDWRHGWQYGLAMGLAAAGLLGYVSKLASRATPPRMRLTMLHGAAALCGLAFLIGTGKLDTLKDDWVANDVFLYGGLGIVAVCAISLITQLRLSRTATTT